MHCIRAAVACLALPLVGCGRLLTVEIDTEATTTIEGGTVLEAVVGDLGFGGFLAIDVTDNETLKNQGVEPGDLVAVALRALTLEAEDGDGDLAFIEEIEVFAEAPDLDAVQVAWADTFESGDALVAMNIPDVDLVDYATSAQMTLRSEARARRPTQTTRVRARATLEVQATVRGAARQAGAR